jgi:hypothetical protein
MKFENAVKQMNKAERFRATVYAMNTLLLHKGIYTKAEFERLFCEHARKFAIPPTQKQIEHIVDSMYEKQENRAGPARGRKR